MIGEARVWRGSRAVPTRGRLDIAAGERPGGDAVRADDLPVLGHDEAWTRHAACAVVPVDGEPFFPAPGDDGAAARAVCRVCPVVVDCLLYALDNCEEHGIWGGASEASRRPLARLERDHAGFDVECSCVFCGAVSEHLRRLRDAGWVRGARKPGGPVVSFGPGATHGKASTWGRGCRCDDCRVAKLDALRRAKERKADRERSEVSA